MNKSNEETQPLPVKPRRKRRWRRFFLWTGLLLFVFLLFLLFPGSRMIVSWQLGEWLAREGMAGEFRVEGDAIRGLRVEDLSAQGPGRVLKARRVGFSYRPWELWTGKIRTVFLEEVEVAWDLAVASPGRGKKALGDERERQAPDFKGLVDTVGRWLTPADVKAGVKRFELRKGEQVLADLGGFTLDSEAGLGGMKLRWENLSAMGVALPPQEIEIRLAKGAVFLSGFVLESQLAEIGEMEVTFPRESAIEVNGKLLLAGGEIALAWSDAGEASVTLEAGVVDLRKLALWAEDLARTLQGKDAKELMPSLPPGVAVATALDLSVTGMNRKPEQWLAQTTLRLEAGTEPEDLLPLEIVAGWEEGRADLRLRRPGLAEDLFNGDGTWDGEAKSAAFSLRLRMDEPVSEARLWLGRLAPQITLPILPEGRLEIDATGDIGGAGLSSTRLVALWHGLSTDDGVPFPVELRVDRETAVEPWHIQVTATKEAQRIVSIDATFSETSKRYVGRVDVKGLAPSWFGSFLPQQRDALGHVSSLSFEASGAGDMVAERHEGVLESFTLDVPWSKGPPLQVAGDASWNWPEEAALRATVKDPAGPERPGALRVSLEKKQRSGPWAFSVGLDDKGNTVATVDGSIDERSLVYEVDLSVDGLDPMLAARFAPEETPLAAFGKIALVASGRGDIKQQQHQGKFQLKGASYQPPDMALIKAEAEGTYQWPERVAVARMSLTNDKSAALLDGLVYEPGRITVGDARLRHVGVELSRLTASVPLPTTEMDWRQLLDTDQALRLQLVNTGTDLAVLPTLLPIPALRGLSGKLTADFRLDGTARAPVLGGFVEITNLLYAAVGELPSSSLRLDLGSKDKRLEMSGQWQPRGYPPITWQAAMPFRPGDWARRPEVLANEPLSGSIEAKNWDISLFRPFVPGLKTLEGKLDISLKPGGTVGKPTMQGGLTLTNGGLAFPTRGMPEPKDISIKLVWRGDVVAIEQFKATASGGTLSVGGDIRFRDITKPQLNINLQGRQMLAFRDDSMILRADLDLTLRGPFDAAVLQGEIGIVDSLFFRDMELITVSLPGGAPAPPSLPAGPTRKAGPAVMPVPVPISNWPLDLVVTMKTPFLVRGNLATADIKGSVTIKGTAGRPILDGSFKASTASAKLPLSTLTIPKAKLIFRPDAGLDPFVEVSAFSRVSGYELRLFVEGPLSAPQTYLSSDPPLPESEIMSMLATGVSTDGLQNGDVAMSKLLLLAIDTLERAPAGSYRARLGRLLSGLDNFDLRAGETDPFTGRRMNSATLQLSSKFFITGAMDENNNTRGLLLYVLRFK
jgi:hypothetical protein